MLDVSDRPGVLERLGAALNSSDLTPREDRFGAIELIGALAQMQTNPDAIEHEAEDQAHIDPRAELAAVLIRLKYGGDRALGERATLLLARWVRHQRAFGRWKLRPGGEGGLVEKIVRIGIAEWLFPVCQTCEGRKRVGLDAGLLVTKRTRCKLCRGSGEQQIRSVAWKRGRGGALVRRSCPGCYGSGTKTFQRTIFGKPKDCPACCGTGLRRDNDGEHALELGLDIHVYQRHWLRRLAWLAAALDRLDDLGKHYLQVQQESGIKRTQEASSRSSR